MSNPDEVLTAARSIVKRLRAARQECRNRYADPYRESPTLPVVLDLAETVAALAVLVADLKGGD